MRKQSSLLHTAILLIGLGVAGISHAQDSGPAAFLRSAAQLTAGQTASVSAGQPLVLELATRERREVGVLGAVKLDVSADFFVDQYRHIKEFKRSPEVLQIGEFGKPPRESDLSILTFDPADLRELQRCRPEHCAVKTSKELTQRFRQEAGANPSPKESAAAWSRTLTDYVSQYLKRGNDALVVYNDRRPEVRAAEEFRDLIGEFPAFSQYAVEFVDYLKAFPASDLSGVDSFVYWSKEKTGFKAVISLTHVNIYKKMIGGRPCYFIASNQIYGNHYFESSFSLTVVSAGDSDSDCWMVYLNRSRSDVFRGWFSGVTKSIIRGRVQSMMKKQLAATKKKLEEKYQSVLHR